MASDRDILRELAQRWMALAHRPVMAERKRLWTALHDLKAERFYKQELANGMMMAHDGSIKTFPLRGIKDSPPYLHDGRCFTLEDTVEYFNLVQQLQLTAPEKQDLAAFLKSL